MNPETTAILTAVDHMAVNAIAIGGAMLLATALSLFIALLALRK